MCVGPVPGGTGGRRGGAGGGVSGLGGGRGGGIGGGGGVHSPHVHWPYTVQGFAASRVDQRLVADASKTRDA